MQASVNAVRVGVIGTGLMGSVHARNLHARIPGAVLVGVSDFDHQRAEVLADELGVHAYGSGEELIESDDVEAIVIASPDVTHAGYAIACIRAGKPVLCEKPLAETQIRARDVLEAEQAGGRRLVQIGLMREFDPAHAALRNAVRSGSLGPTVLFRGTHINPAPVGATDVDRAISQSLVHDIHSARFLTGREIVNVFARWVRRDGSDPTECRMATVSCAFDDGSIGLLDVNVESGYGYLVSAEIVGTAATASTVDPATVQVRSSGQASSDIAPNWAARFAPAYLIELEAWVGSIQSGVPVGPSAYDGYIANVIADACIVSAHTFSPVEIPDHPRPSIYI